MAVFTDRMDIILFAITMLEVGRVVGWETQYTHFTINKTCHRLKSLCHYTSFFFYMIWLKARSIRVRWLRFGENEWCILQWMHETKHIWHTQSWLSGKICKQAAGSRWQVRASVAKSFNHNSATQLQQASPI